MKPISALTVGGAMIDTIVEIAPGAIEQMSMTNADASFLMVEEGRKVQARSIDQHIGGGAVNAAVSMVRQGADVATLVKLGEDMGAARVLARLEEEGVDPRHLARTDEAATGASVLLSSHERNAGVFTARGANTLLKEADLPDAAFARDLVYVTGLSNESADRFPMILGKARAGGAFTACNPGIRQLSSRAQPFFENLKNIDLLTVNRVEASRLIPSLVAGGCASRAPLDAREAEPDSLLAQGLEAGGFTMDLAAFVCAVTRAGPRIVLVTDGKRGAYAGTAERIVHCGTVPVTVAGTVGAGDAFASTFACQTAMGATLEDALATATHNAAGVIARVDTQSGLLRADALREALASGPQPALTSWALT